MRVDVPFMKADRFSKQIVVAVIFFVASLVAFLVPANSARESGKAPTPPSRAKRVLVISLDGLDARYLWKRDEYDLKIPTLRRLMGEGVTARGVVSVYPSVTYPNHTTVVTGAYPSKHGIFANEVFEAPPAPRTGAGHWFARDIRVETLWSAAARRGLKSGMVSWPVAGGAGDWNVPEIWKPGGTQPETFAEVVTHARPAGLVQEIAGRDADLYRNVTKDEQDDMRARFAEYIIREKRPDVMLVHLFDLDHFEHDYGPFTPEAFAMLEKADTYVARLLAAADRAGTLAETTVFIVSDHGFQSISKQIHPGVLLRRAGLVDVREEEDAKGNLRGTVTDWRAMPYVTGGSCAIILRHPNDRAALAKTRNAFKAFLRQASDKPFRIIEAKEVRRLGSNTRAAFMLEASQGYSFGGSYVGEIVTPSRQRGTHGYLPTRPDYHTSFIASGAGVTKRGHVGVVRMIDIGPTVASSLGMTLSGADGKRLKLR